MTAAAFFLERAAAAAGALGAAIAASPVEFAAFACALVSLSLTVKDCLDRRPRLATAWCAVLAASAAIWFAWGMG